MHVYLGSVHDWGTVWGRVAWVCIDTHGFIWRYIDTSQLHLRNEEDLDIVSMGREDGIDTVVRIDTPIDTFGPYGSKFLPSLGKKICTQTYRYGRPLHLKMYRYAGKSVSIPRACMRRIDTVPWDVSIRLNCAESK